jgi:hypothetical protein
MTTLAIPQHRAADASAALIWTGRVLSSLLILFLAFDGGARIAGFAPYIEGLVRYGYPITSAPWIGGALLVATALYAFPRTALLGAILITAYLGGATATHVRAGEPWFFAVGFGVTAWVALVLRDTFVRELARAAVLRDRN